MTQKDTPNNQPKIGFLVHKALDLLNSGAFEESLSQFSKLITQYPHVPEIWYGCALASARLNRSVEAKSALSKLLEIIPSHTKGLALLSELQGEVTTKTPQIKNHETTIISPETDKEEVYALLQKGVENLKAKKFEEAHNYLLKAKKYKIRIPGLDYIRGLCFLSLDKTADAREAFKEELRYYPDNKDAGNFLKEIQDKSGEIYDPNFKSEDPEFNDLLKKVRSYTMLWENRLYSLYQLAKYVCTENIPGNFVECGVAGGGSTALLATVISRYSKEPRLIYACDSYEGMPAPGQHDTADGMDAETTGWGTGTCSAPEDSVKAACKSLGVEKHLVVVKGLFADSLPPIKNKIGTVAMLHIDCDWYEGTRDVLENLFDQVSDRAPIQLDDYGYWAGIAKALHEFENKRGLSFRIENLGGAARFIKNDRVLNLSSQGQRII